MHKQALANTHIFLTGDADQLPPVGPGSVLRDIMESGVVPVVDLRKIFRQVGLVWEPCCADTIAIFMVS